VVANIKETISLDMISNKLNRYRTHKGGLSTNNLDYGSSFSLVFDKRHFTYFIIETKKQVMYNRPYIRGGLDIIGFHLAKYSWRHKLLNKVGDILKPVDPKEANVIGF
jgi:hypothetical protein